MVDGGGGGISCMLVLRWRQSPIILLFLLLLCCFCFVTRTENVVVVVAVFILILETLCTRIALSFPAIFLSLALTHSFTLALVVSPVDGWSKNCARITLRMGSNNCCTELWVGRRKKRGAFPNTFSSKEGGDALTHWPHWVCCCAVCD